MIRHFPICALLALAFVAGVLYAPVTRAEGWAPTKMVRIVVPVVGGTNDVVARLVAPELQKALGQTVIVENKAGAGGTIGTEEVAKSAPDGHSLLIGFNGPIAVNKTLFKKLPYDPVKDLAPITLAVKSGQVLAINSSVPAKNLTEFVALVRSQPGKLSYASVSAGSASHLTMEMLKSAAGIDIVHIPYKGASQAVTDLVAGNVQAAFQIPDMKSWLHHYIWHRPHQGIGRAVPISRHNFQGNAQALLDRLS